MEKNKKRPSTTAKDKNEKILGQWISHQIQKREKPMFDPTFYVLYIYCELKKHSDRNPGSGIQIPNRKLTIKQLVLNKHLHMKYLPITFSHRTALVLL